MLVDLGWPNEGYGTNGCLGSTALRRRGSLGKHPCRNALLLHANKQSYFAHAGGDTLYSAAVIAWSGCSPPGRKTSLTEDPPRRGG